MLNEEKIRLMTKAASFEAGEGKKALSMNKFFQGDYISIQLIWAWLSYTVAFCLCVALWVFYKMEYLMTNINKLDLAAMGKGLALLYLGLLGVFSGYQLCGLPQKISGKPQKTGGLSSYSEAAFAYLSGGIPGWKQRIYSRRRKTP